MDTKVESLVELVSFTLYGAPRTKKTHNQVVFVDGKPKVLPSPQWRNWVRTSNHSFNYKNVSTFPIREYIACEALFYLERQQGDIHGYMQGLADLLEKKGFIHNDRQIKSWDGTRLLSDKANPRVEVVLSRMV